MTPSLAFASMVLVAYRVSLASAFALPSLPLPPPSLRSPSQSTSAAGRDTSLPAVREATFGMGCFWEPAESLLKQPGVLATTAGYTGAPPDKPAPTYDAVCFGRDWVEAVRVAYDDEVVSYDQLLDYFFQLQKPGNSRQYASIIFTNDAGEETDAKQWQEKSASSGKKGRDDNFSYDMVEIEPAAAFYRAEEYHQRYWEKQRLRFFIAIALIAGESGAYDNFFDGALENVDLFGLSFHSVCGAIFVAGAAWVLVERLIARDVRELKQGELMALTLEN